MIAPAVELDGMVGDGAEQVDASGSTVVMLAPATEPEGMDGDGDRDREEQADASANNTGPLNNSGRKNRSEVRDYFQIIPSVNREPPKAKCNHCGRELTWGHGTSALHKHLKSCNKKCSAIEETPNRPSVGNSVQNGATISTNDSDRRKRKRTEYNVATTTQVQNLSRSSTSLIFHPGVGIDLVAGAVGSIITKLSELLQAEYRLQKGLAGQIVYLKNELETAHTALCKVGATPREHQDPQVRLWAREVREASYDMEDILDTFLVDGMEGAAPQNKAHHDIASVIEDMKKQLQEVSDRRDRYSIPVAVPVPATTVDPRLVDMHKAAGTIIGIERTRVELKGMLQSTTHGHGDAGTSRSSNKTKIVSVVGACGLGKTTLAKAVYDELSAGYDCRAFVSVGNNPDVLQVFTSIIFRLDKRMYQGIRDVKDIQLLSDELRDFLENKRYFVVIDDIWEPQSWEIIKSALVENNCGSKVIITTRKLEVANEANEVYKLEPLSNDSSKKLFYTRLFGSEDKCPPNHVVELSDQILKKCGGVPLAIITMASLLVRKSRAEWLEVCGSRGFYRDNDDWRMGNTMHILSLSYYDLPPHLKTCLLYLSVFPEDTIIDKESLIWKWIAEGFVEKKPGRGLFEVGDQYYHDLINRSMIQADLHLGIIECCRVHDMVLDLIISMSLEEQFANADGTLSKSHTRRLAIKNMDLDLTLNTDVNLPQVRSFIVWQCDIVKWAFHPRLKLIRVLALENCTISEGCDSLECLGNLLHLRYLRIGGSRIKELPEGIGALKFLQILDMEDTGIQELPRSIGMLTQLVCLRAVGIRVQDEVIGRLTTLEELRTGGPPDNDRSERQFVKDLANLCELRVLRISIQTTRDRGTGVGSQSDLMQSYLIHSLGKLQKIQHLIMNYSIDNMTATDAALPSPDLRWLSLLYIRFPKLPSWINSAHLAALSHLDISVLDLDEQGVKALGGLPELCYLWLDIFSKATITIANTEAGGCFQKLRSLELTSSAVKFVAHADSKALGVVMPKLEELEFTVFVDELMRNNVISCLDLGLECLPSLCHVMVELESDDASQDDVQTVADALRHAIKGHPNCPTITIVGMRSEEDEDFNYSGSDDEASADTEEDEDSNCSRSDNEEAEEVQQRKTPLC